MKRPTFTLGAIAAVLLAGVLLIGCGSDKPEASLASAKEYLAKNDPKAAVIELKNALQEKPDLAEARFLLGKTLLNTGDAVSAEKELRKAAEFKYAPDQVLPELANTILSQGQFKKVIDEFGKSTLTAPEATAKLQTVIGQAQFALGNREAAAAAFEAATATKSGYSPAMIGQAKLKLAARDLPGALALVDAALTTSPQLGQGWQLKGDLLLADAKPEEALAAYRKAVAVSPDDLRARGAIVSVLVLQGKQDDAAKEVAEMKRIAPKHPHTLYFEALVAYQQKNFTAARDAIQKQLQAAPDDLAGLLLSGSVAYELKSYAQAESNLLKVLQAVPNQGFARRALIATYLRTGQPAKALETLKPIVDRIDQDSAMLSLAGEVYMQNGNVAEAGRYFDKSATLDPKNTQKRTAAALAHLAQGEAQPAFQELEEAAAEDKDNRADLALIAAHMRRGEPDKALAAIDALEKKQPETPLPHSLRGMALLSKGDKDGARRSFERAVALSPTFIPAVVGLARLDLADKKPREAKKRFDAVLAKDPNNVSALLGLAELRSRAAGSSDEVVALIDKAIAANRNAPIPRLALIDHYLRNKEPKKAVSSAQDALAVMHEDPQILEALGRAQLAAGEKEQAITTYNRLAQLQPESPFAWLRVAQAQTAAKNKLAAVESLRKAVALKPDFLLAQEGIVELEREAGHVREAVAMAREVQKQRPQESVGYILEGDTHAYRKDWSGATAAYRAGLKQPGGADLAIKLHWALVASGDTGADKFATSWIKGHPKDTNFRLYLAASARVKKDYPTAAQHYRAIIEATPDNALVLNNLAWVAGQMKDPKALQYAEKANELAPNQPHIMDTLGTLLIEKGDTARGVELLRKASTLAPGATEIRFNLAKGLIKTGQKDDAKKELEVLTKLGDKFPRQREVTELMKGL